MKLSETVDLLLEEAKKDAVVNIDLQEALAEAEKLSDQFADVRPVPYIVPIERFAGLPVLGEHKPGKF